MRREFRAESVRLCAGRFSALSRRAPPPSDSGRTRRPSRSETRTARDSAALQARPCMAPMPNSRAVTGARRRPSTPGGPSCRNRAEGMKNGSSDGTISFSTGNVVTNLGICYFTKKENTSTILPNKDGVFKNGICVQLTGYKR